MNAPRTPDCCGADQLWWRIFRQVETRGEPVEHHLAVSAGHGQEQQRDDSTDLL